MAPIKTEGIDMIMHPTAAAYDNIWAFRTVLADKTRWKYTWNYKNENKKVTNFLLAAWRNREWLTEINLFAKTFIHKYKIPCIYFYEEMIIKMTICDLWMENL
jgi:hypothetical protein